jgi:hypothetical protein
VYEQGRENFQTAAELGRVTEEISAAASEA